MTKIVATRKLCVGSKIPPHPLHPSPSPPPPPGIKCQNDSTANQIPKSSRITKAKIFHRRVRTLCPYGQGIGINLISSGRLKMLKEENKWWELNEERQEGRSRSRLLADHRPLHILSTHYVAADIFRDQIFGVKLWEAHLAEGGLRFSGGFFGGWGWVGEWRGQLSFLQQSAANHRHHRLINNNHHRLINNNQHLRSTTTNTWDQQQLTQIDQQGDAVSVSYYRHISKYKLYRNLQILPAKLAKSFFLWKELY